MQGMLQLISANAGSWICCASPRFGGRSHWATRYLTTASAKIAEDTGLLPAHLSYTPEKVTDMPTLLLMAQSASASEYDKSSFWRALTLQSQRLRSSVSLSEFGEFVGALASARHRDDELMYNFGDAILEDLAALDADTLGSALRSHALIGFRNDRVLKRLETLLFEMMQASRVTAGGLSSAMWSLAKLHEQELVTRPTKDLIDATGRMIVQHASLFSVEQLVELLECFGTLRLQGEQQIAAALSSIGGIFAREAKRLSSRHCASAARAFAKCRVHDERVLLAVAKRMRDRETREAMSPEELSQTLYGLAKFTCQDTALLDLLSIEGRRRLHLMDLKLVSSVLASLAKTGTRSQVLTSRAAVKLRRAPAEELDDIPINVLSILAMAFGKMQAYDQKIFDVLGETFMRRSVQLLENTPCSQLVMIVHAFTKVHAVHDALFHGLTHSLADRFDELSLQHVVQLLHATAKVEFPLPMPLQERIAELLDAQNVAKLSVFELLKVSTAARRLGMQMTALEEQLGVVLPNETKGGDFTMPRAKMSAAPKRKSARKRKWTW